MNTFNRQNLNDHRERGTALLSVLIIFSALTMVGYRIANQYQTAQAAILTGTLVTGNQIEAKFLLQDTLSCTSVRAAIAKCISGAQTVALESTDGSLIMPMPGVLWSNSTGNKVFHMRAQCAGSAVNIQTAKMKPNTSIGSKNPEDFYAIGISLRPFDWSHPLSKILTVDETCRNLRDQSGPSDFSPSATDTSTPEPLDYSQTAQLAWRGMNGVRNDSRPYYSRVLSTAFPSARGALELLQMCVKDRKFINSCLTKGKNACAPKLPYWSYDWHAGKSCVCICI